MPYEDSIPESKANRHRFQMVALTPLEIPDRRTFPGGPIYTHANTPQAYQSSSPRRYSTSLPTSNSSASDQSSALFRQYTNQYDVLNRNSSFSLASHPGSSEEEADHNAADTLTAMRNSPSRYEYTTSESSALGSLPRLNGSIGSNNSDARVNILPPPTPPASAAYGPLRNDNRTFGPMLQHPGYPRNDLSRAAQDLNPLQLSMSLLTSGIYAPGPIRTNRNQGLSSYHANTRYVPYGRPVRSTSLSPRSQMPPPPLRLPGTENRPSHHPILSDYEAPAHPTPTSNPSPNHCSPSTTTNTLEPPNGKWSCYNTADNTCTNENPRKCLSHFFGRNKSETKRVPPEAWIWVCRKHYQRGRYTANKEGVYWKVQIGMLRDQIDRMARVMGDITWRIQWTSDLDKKLREYRDSARDGRTHRSGEYDPEVVGADRLSYLTGEEKDTAAVRNFVDEMQALGEQDMIKDQLLRVEFLPARWTMQQRKQ